MPMYDSLADQIKYFLLNGGDSMSLRTWVRTYLISSTPSLARFLGLSHEHARHTHVLWCAHCWLMDCWEHTPRLLFISPEAGCGKTRALTVTSIWCHGRITSRT